MAGEQCFGKSAWKADALPLGDSRAVGILPQENRVSFTERAPLSRRADALHFSIKIELEHYPSVSRTITLLMAFCLALYTICKVFESDKI